MRENREMLPEFIYFALGNKRAFRCLHLSAIFTLPFIQGRTAATVSALTFFIAWLLALPYPVLITGVHDVEFEYLSLLSGYILEMSIEETIPDT